MSIANIVVERDRALIGVDTLAAYMPGADAVMSEEERRDRHACKVSFLPQISCAVTGRGDHMLIAYVHFYLYVGAVRSFDHAVQAMPEALKTAFSQTMAWRAVNLPDESLVKFPGADVMLVGWSPSIMRFEAARWIRREEDEDFAHTRIDSALLTPEIDRVELVEAPDTPAKMEAVACQQMKWVNENYPGTCGGRLLLAELKRGEVNVRTIANLE
jgi:hypothetical protein